MSQLSIPPPESPAPDPKRTGTEEIPPTGSATTPTTISTSPLSPTGEKSTHVTSPSSRPAGVKRERIPGWKRRLRRADSVVTPYAFISPFFLLLIVFGLIPMVYTFWVSLHKWSTRNPEREFVGLENYHWLIFEFDRFGWSIVNTLGMLFVATVPQLIIALMVANALNKRLRAMTMWRMLILVPIVTSVVAVGIIFARIWGYQYGMVNGFLGLFGIENINWQADRLTSWFAISTMVDWRWMGYNALIYLAAMQTIPRTLYEAAVLDGANSRQQFWKITVPQIKPVIVFTVFVSTVGGMMLMAEPMMFDAGRLGGGSEGQFQTTSMLLVDILRTHGNYGVSAAAGWLLFLVIGFVAVLNYLVVNRIRGEK